jgi:hypothetical protein
MDDAYTAVLECQLRGVSMMDDVYYRT